MSEDYGSILAELQLCIEANEQARERIRTLEARYQEEYAAHQRTLVVGREEIERLQAEVARLQENEYAVLHKGLDLMAWVTVAEAAQARVRELEAALEETYDLYDAGESAACAYERGDLVECRRQHRRAEGIKERIRAALTEPTPPAGEQGK